MTEQNSPNAMTETGEMRDLAMRAQISQEVATAKQYPRDIARSYKEVKDLIAADPEIAEEAYYALPPRKSKKTGQLSAPITGPSIRLAEMVAMAWGNIRTGARIVDVDKVNKMVTVEGVAYDTEKNVSAQEEVARRILWSGDDAVQVALGQARSIAIRNVVSRLAGPYMKKLAEYAMSATAKTADLPTRRNKMMRYFQGMGVSQEEIMRRLELPEDASVDDISEEQVQYLRGLANSIKEGATSVAETFNQKPERESASIDPDTIRPKQDEGPPAEEESAEAPATATKRELTRQEKLVAACQEKIADKGMSAAQVKALIEEFLPENWKEGSELEDLRAVTLQNILNALS